MQIYDKVGSSYDAMRSQIGVKAILDEVASLGKDIKVLDLGCGTGHPIAKAVSPIVQDYCGIDSSQSMLDGYLKNVHDASCRLLDMVDIDQITGKWDFIFSWGAMCHLPIEKQKKTMKAACNLLKPGGRFLFTSGKESGERDGTVGEYIVHHYSMGRSAYIKFLTEQGMKCIHASYGEGDFYVYKFMKQT
ncbi:MAG: class I SAM-dependent methyltransferase [Deferribacteres bacterium]|nr:class I SAM-dependent methyltransferase [Deferribacteres bacterium]